MKLDRGRAHAYGGLIASKAHSCNHVHIIVKYVSQAIVIM